LNQLGFPDDSVLNQFFDSFLKMMNDHVTNATRNERENVNVISPHRRGTSATFQRLPIPHAANVANIRFLLIAKRIIMRRSILNGRPIIFEPLES
jgi:hypothetical protein